MFTGCSEDDSKMSRAEFYRYILSKNSERSMNSSTISKSIKTIVSTPPENQPPEEVEPGIWFSYNNLTMSYDNECLSGECTFTFDGEFITEYSGYQIMSNTITGTISDEFHEDYILNYDTGSFALTCSYISNGTLVIIGEYGGTLSFNNLEFKLTMDETNNPKFQFEGGTVTIDGEVISIF